ncbi:MAG: hypothetical protein F6K30_29400 [Cyanothece sp. SIO2G6]|nr:hypothetical protein [Cyanothece sp. SIO2G6]
MKYRIFLFIFPFIIALILLPLFVFNGKSPEFVAFFFFSSGFISEAVKETMFFQKMKKNRAINQILDLIKLYIYSFSLFIIGIIHVVGNLNFPSFLILDGWNNLYTISTRIIWFSTVFFCCLLTQFYMPRERNLRSSTGTIKIINAFFQALSFPAISIPILIEVTDFININFPRNIVEKLLL